MFEQGSKVLTVDERWCASELKKRFGFSVGGAGGRGRLFGAAESDVLPRAAAAARAGRVRTPQRGGAARRAHPPRPDDDAAQRHHGALHGARRRRPRRRPRLLPGLFFLFSLSFFLAFQTGSPTGGSRPQPRGRLIQPCFLTPPPFEAETGVPKCWVVTPIRGRLTQAWNELWP